MGMFEVECWSLEGVIHGGTYVEARNHVSNAQTPISEKGTYSFRLLGQVEELANEDIDKHTEVICIEIF